MSEELWLQPIEDALRRLGRFWPGAEVLLQDCAALRGKLARLEGSGSLLVTVAFTGPKNAGKTTVLSTLVRDGGVAARLPQGVAAPGATDKLMWVGPEVPPGLRPEEEAYIPAPPEALRELGFPAMLLDTPGYNEGRFQRSQRADTALENAAVVVLVVRRTQLEQVDVPLYLEQARGAHVLPVVTFVNPGDATAAPEVEDFAAGLRARFPESTIHRPLLMRDFELRETATTPEVVLENLGQTLAAAIGSIVQGRSQKELTTQERAQRIAAFRAQIAEAVRQAFPGAADAAQKLAQAEVAVPERVVTRLLGSDEEAARGMRHRLRMLYLERTPGLFFPWRTLCMLAAWSSGAWDRLPGLAMGSLPSLVGTGLAVAKNARDAGNYQEALREGIQNRARELCEEELRPLMARFEASLSTGLPAEQRRPGAPASSVRLHGLEPLQRASTEIIGKVAGAAAMHPIWAVLWALLGTAVFWGIFIWPLLAAYGDYFTVVVERMRGNMVSLDVFPAPSPAMWFTAALLALLPTGILSLLVTGFAGSRGRVKRAVTRITEQHQAEATRLAQEGTLRVELNHPLLDAFVTLMAGARIRN